MDDFIFSTSDAIQTISDDLIVKQTSINFDNLYVYNEEDYMEITFSGSPLTIYTSEDVRNFNLELYNTLGEGNFSNVSNFTIEQWQKICHLMEQKNNFIVLTTSGKIFLKTTPIIFQYSEVNVGIMSLFMQPSDYKPYAFKFFMLSQTQQDVESYFEVIAEERKQLNGIKLLTTLLTSTYDNTKLATSLATYYEYDFDTSAADDFISNSITKSIIDTTIIKKINTTSIRDNFLFDTINTLSFYEKASVTKKEIKSTTETGIFYDSYKYDDMDYYYSEIFPANSKRNFRPYTKEDFIQLNTYVYDYMTSSTQTMSLRDLPIVMKCDILRAFNCYSLSKLIGSLVDERIPPVVQSSDGRYFIQTFFLQETYDLIREIIHYITASYSVAKDYETYAINLSKDSIAESYVFIGNLRAIQLKTDLRLNTNIPTNDSFTNIYNFIKLNKSVSYIENVSTSSFSSKFKSTGSSSSSIGQTFLNPQTRRRKPKQNFAAYFDSLYVNNYDFFILTDTIVNLPGSAVINVLEYTPPTYSAAKPSTTTTVTSTKSTTSTTSTPSIPQVSLTTTETSGSSSLTGTIVFFIIIFIFAIYFFTKSGGGRGNRRRGRMTPMVPMVPMVPR